MNNSEHRQELQVPQRLLVRLTTTDAEHQAIITALNTFGFYAHEQWTLRTDSFVNLEYQPDVKSVTVKLCNSKVCFSEDNNETVNEIKFGVARSDVQGAQPKIEFDITPIKYKDFRAEIKKNERDYNQKEDPELSISLTGEKYKIGDHTLNLGEYSSKEKRMHYTFLQLSYQPLFLKDSPEDLLNYSKNLYYPVIEHLFAFLKIGERSLSDVLRAEFEIQFKAFNQFWQLMAANERYNKMTVSERNIFKGQVFHFFLLLSIATNKKFDSNSPEGYEILKIDDLKARGILQTN